MKPIFIDAEKGKIEIAIPKNNKTFTLKELQNFVGRTVQLITLPSGLQLWINDNGKLDNLPYNEIASLLWKTIYYGYEVGADDFVVGDCLICPPEFTDDHQD